MRLRRLALARYGHLSDVDLAFARTPGLHIVLGANEAGKSTALAAIDDALFGFPKSTPYAFLHTSRDLRVGITLEARDGRTASFVRRKGNKDDLSDAAGAAVPETAIAAFLFGAGKSQFRRFFGLDAATLRAGGEEILRGKGEVGESILQAHTGLHGFRALADRLREDAARLAGDRRGTRELHVALDRFKAAKSARDERIVEPADYKAMVDEQARLEAARAANLHEAAELRAERERLDRIRRTAPARHAIARATAERAALGDVPPMPADAEGQRVAAITARERAAHDLTRLREQDAALAVAFDALLDHTALLAEGDTIDRLAADRSLVAAAAQDRDRLRIVVEQRTMAVAETAHLLGQPAAADALGTRVPDALTRDAAGRAILDHARLSDRRARSREDLEAARFAQEAALAALAALPAPAPSADLRRAIDHVRGEGRLDAERAAAGQAEAAAQADLARLLGALPGWTGTAAALAEADIPLDAAIARLTRAIERAEAANGDATATSASHDRTLATIAADLASLAEAGEIPTPQAIAATRERRDRAWRLLRRHRLDGGDPPTEAELAEAELSGLGDAGSLPDRFEALLHEADTLVDRGTAEASRVAEFTQLRRQKAREEAARLAAGAAAAAAHRALDAARDDWAAAWRPAGIAALPPPAMREWLARRDAVLAQRLRHTDSAARLAELDARHAAARLTLAAAMPDRPAHTGPLAPLLVAAETLCAAREAEEAARRRANDDLDLAKAAMDKASRNHARAEADLAQWASGWSVAASALGLPAHADPETGKLALELWNRAETELRGWREAAGRVQQMTQAIDAFAAEAASVAHRVAPDLADSDPHAATGILAARLADARAAAAERARITDERRRLHAAMTDLAAQRARADSALAALHALARTADDAALEAVLARAARHALLTRDIAAREAELRPLDDGKSLADLAAEADGTDTDALPDRIAGIEARTQDIAADNDAIVAGLHACRARLAAMRTGNDAAGAAQEMETALADIEDIAGRYVRARLAHTLLRAGIDRFRRRQQGPLLARAGALFARLTEGRYIKLDVDEGEKGEFAIVAERPDRTTCPADRLSEGTRDQLYLALRLAAIESYAERTEPLPFIADDLLVNFDDARAKAALRVLGEMGEAIQVIVFTHHAHIVDLADPDLATILRLGDSARTAA